MSGMYRFTYWRWMLKSVPVTRLGINFSVKETRPAKAKRNIEKTFNWERKKTFTQQNSNFGTLYEIRQFPMQLQKPNDMKWHLKKDFSVQSIPDWPDVCKKKRKEKSLYWLDNLVHKPGHSNFKRLLSLDTSILLTVQKIVVHRFSRLQTSTRSRNASIACLTLEVFENE
jgi:hypothetical protein